MRSSDCVCSLVDVGERDYCPACGMFIVIVRTSDGRTVESSATSLEDARMVAVDAVHDAYRAAFPSGEHSDAQRAHRWHVLEVDAFGGEGGLVEGLPGDAWVNVIPVAGEDAPYVLYGFQGGVWMILAVHESLVEIERQYGAYRRAHGFPLRIVRDGVQVSDVPWTS